MFKKRYLFPIFIPVIFYASDIKLDHIFLKIADECSKKIEENLDSELPMYKDIDKRLTLIYLSGKDDGMNFQPNKIEYILSLKRGYITRYGSPKKKYTYDRFSKQKVI